MTSPLINDLSGKYFQALVTGLIKREYYGETEFSNEMLVEQLFADSQMTTDSIAALIRGVLVLIRKAAYHNWDIGRLNSMCESDANLSDEHREILTRLWKSHQMKIHDVLVAKSVWSSTIDSVQWRIDIKTAGRHGELNVPTAIMQIGVTNPDDSKSERIQFEMTRDDVTQTLQKLHAIQETIDKISSGKV